MWTTAQDVVDHDRVSDDSRHRDRHQPAVVRREPGDDRRVGGEQQEPDPGEATSALSARDFDDVAPPALRPDGPPTLHFGVRRFSDALRFNRVEGLFTGVGATLAFRDAAPGLALHANAGWAWAAETPRGALELSIRRGAWEATARAARELAHTNDFASPWERGGSVFTLLGADDAFDYVDRRDVALALARTLRARGTTEDPQPAP